MGSGLRRGVCAMQQAVWAYSTANPTLPHRALRLPHPCPHSDPPSTPPLAAAAAHGASVVLANDPDADRLAASEAAPGGGFASFSGNDIGLLLADWCGWGLPVNAHLGDACSTVVRAEVLLPLNSQANAQAHRPRHSKGVDQLPRAPPQGAAVQGGYAVDGGVVQGARRDGRRGGLPLRGADPGWLGQGLVVWAASSRHRPGQGLAPAPCDSAGTSALPTPPPPPTTPGDPDGLQVAGQRRGAPRGAGLHRAVCL
jgi:hypothetical protein